MDTAAHLWVTLSSHNVRVFFWQVTTLYTNVCLQHVIGRMTIAVPRRRQCVRVHLEMTVCQAVLLARLVKVRSRRLRRSGVEMAIPAHLPCIHAATLSWRLQTSRLFRLQSREALGVPRQPLRRRLQPPLPYVACHYVNGFFVCFVVLVFPHHYYSLISNI